MEKPDRTVKIGAGDHLFFASTQPYAYANAWDGTVQFIRTVVS